MDAGRRGAALTIAACVALALVAAAVWLRRERGFDPNAFASAGLESLRVQNHLSVMRAQFVSVQTQRRSAYLVFTAERTLIVPGTVTYELDLARLTARDVAWDAATRTVRVTAPPVEIVGPAVDLLRMKAFDSGRIARLVSDAEAQLDTATRQAALRDLRAQAADPALLRLARDAARTAIAADFALPLRAAGVSAQVAVRFPDEPRFGARDRETVDRSRALSEVYGTAR